MDEGLSWASAVGMQVPVVRSFTCDTCRRRRSFEEICYDVALPGDGDRHIMMVCRFCMGRRARRRWKVLSHLRRLAKWSKERLAEELTALPCTVADLDVSGRMIRHDA